MQIIENHNSSGDDNDYTITTPGGCAIQDIRPKLILNSVQNFKMIGQLNKWDFARFKLNMRFGWLAYIAQQPRFF